MRIVTDASPCNGILVALALVLGVTPASAQTQLTTVRVAEGLEEPLYVTHAPGDFERVFIVERGVSGNTGKIKILDLTTGQVLPTPFLSLPVVMHTSEQGLLGLTFDPQYATNGHFYTYRNAPGPGNGLALIERYTVSANPDVANPASAHTILQMQPFAAWHNGGWMGFGQDGYLYIALGDDGELSNGQSPDTLRAKVLRIDPRSDGFPGNPDRNYAIPATNPWFGQTGADETYVWGLRNPWRCSLDRATGDLWIGDVGANAYEEINIRPAPTGLPIAAMNYGWSCWEGPECDGGPLCNCAAPFTAPVHYYPHGGSPFQCSVTGGYVYRGCAIPDLQGTYFFADFCANRIWSFRYVGNQVTQFTDRTTELDPGFPRTLRSISSFGEDAFGELYICSLSQGEVYKIVARTPVGPDCNGNGRQDSCDIFAGFSTDGNANGIPDECECYANCNGSYSGTQPTLTVADFGCFQTKFVAGDPYADCNADGQRTVADFGCFQTKFVAGCP